MTHDVLTVDSPVHTKQIISHNKPGKAKNRYLKRDPWLEEPFNSARGEQALWVAVITQAMMDALSQSRNPEAVYHRQAATQWLTGSSKDFVLVCLFAGMDPDYVRKKAKKAIANPSAWRAAPGKGKRYTERKAYRARLRAEPATSDDGGKSTATLAKIITGPWK